MPDPSTLRDSTQIVLPAEELDGVREELEREFTVTIVEAGAEGDAERIVGSPVVIKEVADFLVRQGVNVP